MDIIEVNHSSLRQAANDFRQYAREGNSITTNTVQTCESLSRSWNGNDFTAFITRARGLDSQDSYLRRLCSALNSFADKLEYSADKYRKAQADAINRANRLRV